MGLKGFINCLLGSSIVLFGLVACDTNGGRPDVDISSVDLQPVEIHQYGKALFEIEPDDLREGLKEIQDEYTIFLDADLDDPANLKKIYDFRTDTFLISVAEDCRQIVPDPSEMATQFGQSFRYYRYYYPGTSQPEVYTYVSGFDFQNKVQFTGKELLIALDMFLGPDYDTYKKLGLPVYLLRRFDQKFIVRDCMEEIARSKINFRKVGGNLLDYMINEGKVLWFIVSTCPDVSEEVLFAYNQEELNWINEQEAMVWAYLLENEMLYSPEPTYYQKFILDSPFTSYFGNESPPRLGAWVGYQLVSAYMNRNSDIPLQALMKEYDASKILKKSGYKPKL